MPPGELRPLLRAVLDQVDQVVPERQSQLAVVERPLQIVVVDRLEPGPHLGLVLTPMLGQDGDGRVVLRPEFLVGPPALRWLALEPEPPAPLDVELVNQCRPQVADGQVGGRHEPVRGEARGRRQEPAIGPVQVVEEGRDVVAAHGGLRADRTGPSSRRFMTTTVMVGGPGRRPPPTACAPVRRGRAQVWSRAAVRAAGSRVPGPWPSRPPAPIRALAANRRRRPRIARRRGSGRRRPGRRTP
jgi:hypothetical protein